MSRERYIEAVIKSPSQNRVIRGITRSRVYIGKKTLVIYRGSSPEDSFLCVAVPANRIRKHRYVCEEIISAGRFIGEVMRPYNPEDYFIRLGIERALLIRATEIESKTGEMEN